MSSNYQHPGLPCPVCGEPFETGGYAFMKLGSARCWHGPTNPSDLVEKILMLEERLERLESLSVLTRMEVQLPADALAKVKRAFEEQMRTAKEGR